MNDNTDMAKLQDNEPLITEEMAKKYNEYVTALKEKSDKDTMLK
jgi:hypothetical protein